MIHIYVLLQDGTNTLKQMLKIGAEQDEGTENVAPPNRGYGRQVSLQELFEGEGFGRGLKGKSIAVAQKTWSFIMFAEQILYCHRFGDNFNTLSIFWKFLYIW